jgi:hypothetical protein
MPRPRPLTFALETPSSAFTGEWSFEQPGTTVRRVAAARLRIPHPDRRRDESRMISLNAVRIAVFFFAGNIDDR